MGASPASLLREDWASLLTGWLWEHIHSNSAHQWKPQMLAEDSAPSQGWPAAETLIQWSWEAGGSRGRSRAPGGAGHLGWVPGCGMSCRAKQQLQKD